MATVPPRLAPTLRESLNALLESRLSDPIPRVVNDDSEWETYIPLKKEEHKFEYKEVCPDQTHLHLIFRQYHTKVFTYFS
jgi:hypothetical protein